MSSSTDLSKYFLKYMAYLVIITSFLFYAVNAFVDVDEVQPDGDVAYLYSFIVDGVSGTVPVPVVSDLTLSFKPFQWFLPDFLQDYLAEQVLLFGQLPSFITIPFQIMAYLLLVLFGITVIALVLEAVGAVTPFT